MYTKAASLLDLYIRNVMPDDMSIPSLATLALSGRRCAGFHAGVNFRYTEFSEVRHSHGPIAYPPARIAYIWKSAPTSTIVKIPIAPRTPNTWIMIAAIIQ
jgi:hypothetical protein